MQTAWSATASTTGFRYEGKISGPSISGVQPNQTFTVGIRRVDSCGGSLGLSPWTSNTVTLDDGKFSISPSFNPDALAKAMDPWNDFSAGCSTDFRRQVVINWNGETFVIDMEDSARANLANYAINAVNSAKIGNVPVQTNLVCADGNVLKFSTSNVRFECQPIAVADIPPLLPAQIPALAGDVSGAVNATSVDRIKGIAVNGVPSVNQVLKYNGANWAPANDDTGAIADASYAVKGAVQINTDLATSGLFITGGVLALPNVISPVGPVGSSQNIPVITYDQKGRITAITTAPVDDNTKLSLSGGTMTGDINSNNNVIHSVGKLGVGVSTPLQLIQAAGNDINSIIDVKNLQSSAFRQVGFSATNYAGSTASPVSLSGKVARGTSAAPANVQNGDPVLQINAGAHDGVSAFRAVSGITFVAEENISSASSAGSVRILSTPSGTVTPLERVRVTPSGDVGIGTTAPNAKLDVGGAVKIADDLSSCMAMKAGTVRFNSGNIQYCDGAGIWKTLTGTSAGFASIAQGGTNNNFFNNDQMVFYSMGSGRLQSFSCATGQTIRFLAGGEIDCESPNTANALARFDGLSNLITPGGIDLPPNVTLKLPTYGSADPTGFGTSDKSRVWYNSTTDEIKYWNGSAVRKLASQDGTNNFTGANSFSGTTSIATLTASNITATTGVSASAVSAGTLAASTSLQVGSTPVLTGIVACQNSGSFSSSSTTVTCSGINSTFSCNCQWNALPGTFAAINYITVGTNIINVNFASLAAGSAGSIRCICAK